MEKHNTKLNFAKQIETRKKEAEKLEAKCFRQAAFTQFAEAKQDNNAVNVDTSFRKNNDKS